MEGRRVFAELTVEENLRVGSYSNRAAPGRSALRRMFDLFPVLGERRAQSAGYLSGGEQQMLAIARALMSEPRYLLLDEPSLGLAPRIVEQIRDLIVRLNQEGTSILLVEQNAAMALSVAEHGYIMETGTIALDKPAAALRADDDVREFYLGLHEGETSEVVPRPQALQEAQAMGSLKTLAEVLTGCRSDVPSGRPVLEVRDVELQLRRRPGAARRLLRGPADELFAIIGPNGAGKSSIFNCLSSVYRPQAGSIEFLGRRAHASGAGRGRARRHRADVPEHRAVRHAHRARQPDAGPPPPHPVRPLRRAAVAPAARGARSCASARSSRRSSRSSTWAPTGRRPSARCPTASRSASSSAALSRWSRSCCSWTSRSPG